MIDRVGRGASCWPSSTRSAPTATGSRRCSEERGEIDYGDHDVRVIIDPIDGSLNAKRGISHYALSVAVADGPTMADVAFGFVLRLRPVRGVVGAARRGRVARRRAARPDARPSAAGATAGSRCWGSSRPTRAGSPASIERARGRPPTACARWARSPRRCARSPRPASTGWCRSAFPRRRRRRRPADRPRSRRRRQLPVRATTRSAAPLDADPELAGGRRPHARDAAPSSRGSRRDRLDHRRADRHVRGRQRQRARPPTADLAALAAESEARVVAYTGLEPARPLPPPEGIGRREWVVEQHRLDAASCSTRCSQRASREPRHAAAGGRDRRWGRR